MQMAYYLISDAPEKDTSPCFFHVSTYQLGLARFYSGCFARHGVCTVLCGKNYHLLHSILQPKGQKP
jgi:hypothetical protein